MSDLKRARAFMEMARKDYRVLSEVGHLVDPEIAGFHAQQAVEKALKALLCLRDVHPPRTQDIEALAGAVLDAGESLEGNLEALYGLTDFAVLFRYEPFPSYGEPMEQDEVRSRVEALFVVVEERLKLAAD